MITAKDNIINMLDSPVRKIKARVELYEGSTLINTYSYEDRLKSFSIDRVGEGKLFGYGICQKINLKLIDTNRELEMSTAYTLNVAIGVDSDYIYPFPQFKITECHRDENTNELSITAYDVIYNAVNQTISEIDSADYTIEQLAQDCGAVLGVSVRFINIDAATLAIYYPSGANFEGNEAIREVFNAIAEATQSIYYISGDNTLTFKRLDVEGDAAFTIDKERYISLKSGENRRLTAICHATELGDNVIADMGITGTVVYVRDNPLWELREDIAAIVDNALLAVGGLTINQFDCNWRGNYLVEIGDKIKLITKDDNAVYAYLLDDVITYDGGMSQSTKWEYSVSDTETEANPSNIGDVIKQTYARVDKANKEITLLVSENENNETNISNLVLTTDGINTTVSKTTTALNDLTNEITELTSRVNTQITQDEVKLLIETEINNGVNKVVTNTGYKFDDTGLTVSKSDSEMKTTITDDGMTVYKNSDAVLTANNEGVKAKNLHAVTYLIIGNNSRFEDYGSRTGCFWIGG